METSKLYSLLGEYIKKRKKRMNFVSSTGSVPIWEEPAVFT